jgi:deoxyribonuclease-4
MRFGIHVPRQRNLTSTAGYARSIGCQAMQIFSGNPIGWRIGRLDPADRDGFASVVSDAGIEPVIVHAPYLINLAARESKLRTKSRQALVDAATRAVDLEAGLLVVHAGNHMGLGSRVGIERAIETLDYVLARGPQGARLGIEGGAGKGTEIGVTFEELRDIVEPFPAERVGIVLDTAHLWALGYDLRSASTVEAMLDEFEIGPGLHRLWAIHANDSLAELGSRRDRHALWSKGLMGMRALRLLVRTRGLSRMPVIFEVPGDTEALDRKRLRRMRRLDREARRREAVG